MKADLSQMFDFCEAWKRGAGRADFTCDIAEPRKLARGERDSAILLKQFDRKSRFYDLVGTTHSSLELISKRVQQALCAAQITGWHTLPVEFVDNKGIVIEGYDALVVTGRCGPVIDDRSTKMLGRLPGMIKDIDMWLGYYFDENSWDGSDFFKPRDTDETFVTRRVKDVLETINATNISLRPLFEVERFDLDVFMRDHDPCFDPSQDRVIK